ncbi:MAG: RluA family pseudouridine synthase [Clostridia bacterium]|nr:RluA family pseudouridine synthase [Clostridia bacterium]
MQNISYTATNEDEGRYVKEILQQKLKLSSRLIRKIKVEGHIKMNGRDVHVRERVDVGDVVSVSYPEEKSYFEPEDIPVDVVYEDDDLMVVNKQAGLIVHPTYNFPTGTLANALTYRMNQRGEVYKLRFVNRLDMYTSGLIIVGKNAHCQDAIMNQMADNSIVKKYKAISHGIVEKDMTIDLPIDKDPNHVARRMVREDGYPSITHVKVLDTFDKEFGQLKGFSFLELKLDTGRTHQIRVHLTHMGHPLVGDELYAQLYGYFENPEWMPRQALHSYYLNFAHPVTGKRIEVETDIPDDMKSALSYIENL